jgi:hypothetical protein
MNVSIKSNWFGRPYKAYAHHYVSIGFNITGGSGNYEFRRQLFGNWTPWQDVVSFGNQDGYAIHSYLFHLAFPIEVRDKGNQEVWTNNSFELFYKNNLTAIHMGTTPVIVDASLAVGATSITVKAPVSCLIKVYKSNGNTFDALSEPIVEGVIGLSGQKTFTIPAAVAGDRYVATASHRDPINNRTYSFESLSSQYIEVGGIKKPQLEAVVEYTADKVTSVTGGSGNYAVGRLNNGTFDVAVNQVFDIPFGVDNIFVRDTAAPDNEHISVLVDGGIAPTSSGTNYSYNIRSNFSSSSANQDKVGFRVKYGKKVGTSFTQFDSFGNFDNRQAWAMASDSDGMPQIGIDENQGTLASNRVLMHPHTDGNATIRFEALQAGTFQINGDALRAARTDNPWSSPPQTGMSGTLKVLHNGTQKVAIILNTQDEVKALAVSGFTVAVGDIIDLEMQNTSGDGSFGHYHVSSVAQLQTQGQTATAPTAPTITSSTPQALGATINGSGHVAGQYIIIFKDGFPHSLAITDGTGSFSFGAMYAGSYTARASTADLLSLDSNAIVVNAGSVSACPLPTAAITNNQSSNTVVAGVGGFGLSCAFTNKTALQWYKDGIAISGATQQQLTVSLAQVTDAGVYKCKVINACGTGTTSEVYSNEITITVTSSTQVDCALITHLSPLGIWSASPNTPFKAIKFVNTGGKPFVGQITSENPLKFVLRGKNSVGSITLQGNQFVWANGIDGTVVNCLGGADTGIQGLQTPTDFPMPPNYEVVGGIYQPISGGSGSTVIKRVPGKIGGTCASEILQFGYSTTANNPSSVTNWIDRQGTVLCSTSGGETIEVTTGGELYQYADFTLSAGMYYFYVRQKTSTTNVVMLAVFTVTI